MGPLYRIPYRPWFVGLTLIASLSFSLFSKGKEEASITLGSTNKKVPIVVPLLKKEAEATSLSASSAKAPASSAKATASEAKAQALSAKNSADADPSSAFAELKFNKTLIIEGRVEKPQVQFTLLKEPPPEKEVQFETSFLKNILKLDRENTFKVNETYGR